MDTVKKYGLGILVLAALCLSACSQAPGAGPDPELAFVKFFGGELNQQAHRVIQTSDGGYVLVGSSESFTRQAQREKDIYVVRTDSRGNLLSERVIGGGGMDEAIAIVEAPDGGFAICGTRTDASGDKNVYLARLGENLDLIWEQSFGEAGVDESGSDLSATSDGGYILTGVSMKYGSMDTYTLKVNADGTPAWGQARVYGSPGKDSATAVWQAANGFCLLATTAFEEDEATGSNLLLLQLDENGLPLDYKVLGAAGTQRAAAAFLEPDKKNLLLFGTTVDPVSKQPSLFLVSNISSTDDVDFTVQQPSGGEASSVIRRRDGSLAFLATQKNNITLLLADASGKVRQVRQFARSSRARSAHLIETADGSLVFTGTISFGRNEMMCLIKTTPNGTLTP